MSYTYTEPVDGAFPDPISEVRYYLGDVAPEAPFSLTDAEIEFLLAQTGATTRSAAANAAYQMGIRYTKASSTTGETKSVGNLSLTRQQNFADLGGRYYALAETLRSGADQKTLVAGPIFEQIDTQFYIGQFDYPGQ